MKVNCSHEHMCVLKIKIARIRAVRCRRALSASLRRSTSTYSRAIGEKYAVCRSFISHKMTVHLYSYVNLNGARAYRRQGLEVIVFSKNTGPRVLRLLSARHII
jgi:hypothetical protein